ncbi:thioredoxin family protein [Staphylococcus pseudintermedius]|nr:thioredoxin family protein [Staphylococcus pseudintermedius]
MKETKFILFGSPTCNPCKVVKSHLESINFKYEYVDVMERPDLAGEYGVMSTPTMIHLVDSIMVNKEVGLKINAFVEQF